MNLGKKHQAFLVIDPGRFHIYKGKNGNIWLGNNWGEIVIIDPLTNEVESFHLQNNKGERIQTVIYSLCLDSWNRLWVGTSNGLMQVELETHECKSIKLPEKIKNVFTIAEDKEGNVDWDG